MLVAGQLGAVWRYTYHGSERSSFSSKLKEWWKSTFLDSWTEVPEISLSLKITGGEKKKKTTRALLVLLHVLWIVTHPVKTKQGGAESKLRLARSEAAFQEKSSFLSANQSEVQEPGRLPGQHG